MHQVDLVDPCVRREFSCLVSRLRDLLIVLARDLRADSFGKAPKKIRHRIGKLRQIYQGKRCFLSPALPVAGLHKRIYDLFSELHGGG